jgi:hypothetical protein
MAAWVTASLADLLPPGVDTIITAINALLSVVTQALGVVQTGLNIAKSVLGLISILFDLIGTLREAIENLKKDLIASGIYVCNMLDYPIVQLQRKQSYGPDMDYTRLAFDGQPFNTSFLKDLAGSFYDSYDNNRPQFTDTCAMMVLVVGAPSLPALNIDISEGNPFNIFPGLADSAQSVGNKIRSMLFNVSLYIARVCAESQSTDKVSARVKRVTDAFRIIHALNEQQKGGLTVLLDPVTGKPYLLQAAKTSINNTIVVDPSLLSWDYDVVPLLEIVEAQVGVSVYPDWGRLTLREINPGLVELIEAVFDPVLDLLQSAYSIKDQITAMIAVVDKKLKFLKDLIGYITTIQEYITDLLNSTGFMGIFISSNTGVEGLRTKLLNATGSLYGTNNGFYSGFAILAGSTQATAFTTLFSPVAT